MLLQHWQPNRGKWQKYKKRHTETNIKEPNNGKRTSFIRTVLNQYLKQRKKNIFICSLIRVKFLYINRKVLSMFFLIFLLFQVSKSIYITFSRVSSSSPSKDITYLRITFSKYSEHKPSCISVIIVIELFFVFLCQYFF